MIVALHGFTGSPASWDSVRRIVGGRWFSPALLGHESEQGAGEDLKSSVASFDDEVDRLADSVRAVAAPPRRLVGYSLGGRVGLGLLVRHPDLFESATLIGASPGLASEAERTARRASDEALARLLENEGLDAFLKRWRGLPLFASQRRLTHEVLQRQEEIRRSHRAEGLARSLRALGLGSMPDRRADLPQIEIPVTLAVGEEDAKFRALGEEMLRLLPRATIEIVPGVGHNVVLEAPAAIVRHL